MRVARMQVQAAELAVQIDQAMVRYDMHNATSPVPTVLVELHLHVQRVLRSLPFSVSCLWDLTSVVNCRARQKQMASSCCGSCVKRASFVALVADGRWAGSMDGLCGHTW